MYPLTGETLKLLLSLLSPFLCAVFFPPFTLIFPIPMNSWDPSLLVSLSPLDVWNWSAWDKAPGPVCGQEAGFAPSLSFPLQEFGLARFKSNVTKSTKGFEYVLARMQGEHPRADWD